MDLTLECCSLGFRYGQRKILEDLSFKVEPGLFYAVLGKNGSGKTTLLHCLNKILKPTAGAVKVMGRNLVDLSQGEIARNISFVPQEHMDIFPFRVIDVVIMGRAPFLGMTQIPGEKERRLAMEALKLLGFEHLAGCNFNRISGGERQIVILAMALVQAGRVMLLDEPTNHLDFHNQYHLLSKIKKLCKTRQISVVASMHDPNMAMLFADRIIMLKHGRLIAQGGVEQTMTTANLDLLYDTRTAAVSSFNPGRFFLPESAMTAITGDSNKE
ncbi:MAG: ABC transporter ATP-binding protein [Desulfobacterium sp.]|nr:ABC transporter ATP-binding protein [Desulfobacterium sp.]